MKQDQDDELNSPEIIKRRIEENMLLGIMSEIGLLKGHPRLQIFVTHGFLELIMHALVKSKAKKGKKITDDSRSYPYSTKILILHEIGVLNDDDYKAYDWFRKIRNKAAHEPLFKLTNDHLKVVKIGKSIDVENFDELCAALILRLWNDNMQILGPLFVPTILSFRE